MKAVSVVRFPMSHREDAESFLTKLAGYEKKREIQNEKVQIANE